MGNKVVHFEVSGPDPEGLGTFYADLFGWKVDADNPMNYGMVSADDAGIGGGISPLPPGGAPHLTFYVEVDDLQAALDRAVELGGKIVSPPMDIPDGPSIAHFHDPAGNFVGLVKSDSM